MGKSKKSDSPVSDNENGSENEADWLEVAIDLLASEYHWSKTEILEKVYVDELWNFQKLIRQRKIIGYKMQLAIVQNPHLTDEDERRALWDMLDGQLEEDGVTVVEPVQEELDKSAFEGMKFAMSGNPRIVIK